MSLVKKASATTMRLVVPTLLPNHTSYCLNYGFNVFRKSYQNGSKPMLFFYFPEWKQGKMQYEIMFNISTCFVLMGIF